MLDRSLATLALQALRNRFPSLEVLPGKAQDPVGRLTLGDGEVRSAMVLLVDDGFVVWLGHFTPCWCPTAGVLAELFTELTQGHGPRSGPRLKRAQAQWLRRLLSRSGGWVFNEPEAGLESDGALA